MTGLSLRDVVVRYPGATAPAVDGVSLDVAPGSVVALLGPSGCGKSSLLRAVAGLEPLASGTVSWDGTSLAGVPVHRRGFGLMFQDGQLFAHRSVGGNVGYGLPRGSSVSPLLDGSIRESLTVEASLASRNGVGGTAPERVAEQLAVLTERVRELDPRRQL